MTSHSDGVRSDVYRIPMLIGESESLYNCKMHDLSSFSQRCHFLNRLLVVDSCVFALVFRPAFVAAPGSILCDLASDIIILFVFVPTTNQLPYENLYKDTTGGQQQTAHNQPALCRMNTIEVPSCTTRRLPASRETTL